MGRAGKSLVPGITMLSRDISEELEEFINEDWFLIFNTV